jgi:hypothetical protein
MASDSQGTVEQQLTLTTTPRIRRSIRLLATEGIAAKRFLHLPGVVSRSEDVAK